MSSSKRFSRGLVRCSFLDKVKDNNCINNNKKKKKKKSKISKKGFSSSINKPLVTTVTKTTTVTTNITIIIPPEDPNYHINLYFCIRTPCSNPPYGCFKWCKIDPTETGLDVEVEMEEDPNSTFKPNPKSESNTIFLTPISSMPTTIPLSFCIIPQYSSNNKYKQQNMKKKKLVYAIGGQRPEGGPGSPKALVCDFAAVHPVWEELPPMPWPMIAYFGVASPLDGTVYAFGRRFDTETNTQVDTYTGVVFDPVSRSWNPRPHPYIKTFTRNRDYVLVQTQDRNEFIVFRTERNEHVAFNLTSGDWESGFCAPIQWHKYSSFVAVGDIIYRLKNIKLYALDLASKKPRFKRVYGLEEEMPVTCETFGLGYLAYLGKGKLCIVWGGPDLDVKEADNVHITCLEFWVGVCNDRNQLWAVVDRCVHYAAPGYNLHDFVAF